MHIVPSSLISTIQSLPESVQPNSLSALAENKICHTLKVQDYGEIARWTFFAIGAGLLGLAVITIAVRVFGDSQSRGPHTSPGSGPRPHGRTPPPPIPPGGGGGANPGGSIGMRKLDHWSQTALPGKREGRVLQYNGASLCLVKGGISADINGGPIGAVVNAANEQMYYGGGGTNRALSNATTEASWNQARNTLGRNLNISEVQEAQWTPSKPAVQAQYIFQALGPKASDYGSDFEKGGQMVRKAYQNIFQKCRDLNLDSVQLCLLSAGIFAPDGARRAEWIAKVEGIVLECIEAEFQRPDGVKKVILVDYKTVPFSRFTV